MYIHKGKRMKDNGIKYIKNTTANIRINKQIKADLKREGLTVQIIVDKFIKKFTKKAKK